MGIAKDNITAIQQNKFNQEVINGLVEMGAVKQPTDESMLQNTQFKLETIAGTLLITLYHHQKFLFTVYSMFEEPERAKGKFNCNPYSGKYNFHMSVERGKRTIDDVIELALMHFECTLKNELA